MHLPLQVASPVDVGRMQRELTAINEQLTQAELRDDNSETRLPKTTNLLDQTLQLNTLDLTNAGQRQQLLTFLTTVKTKAPLLHISFSADPSTSFIDLLLTWLRKELHPNLLITIGLQPNIGAGCIVRSTNKYFDFSLRQDFAGKRDLLLDKLGPALAGPAAAPELAPIPSVTSAVQVAEASRGAAAQAQTVHTAPQPTAKLMTAPTAQPATVADPEVPA